MRPWPCVLCGAPAVVGQTDNGDWHTQCPHHCQGMFGPDERASVIAWNDMMKANCPKCAGPTRHEGSPRCPQRKSLASGGHVAHCTCDTCF